MALVCAVELVQHGHFETAAAVLTGFDCYLRHSELRNLRVGHVAFAGDVRLRGEALAGLNLWCTKSADLQWVSVRDPLAADMLLSLCQGRTPESFVFSRERMSLLELFQSSQLWAGFAFPMFFMHYLRHGGATWDFLKRSCRLKTLCFVAVGLAFQ